MAGALVNPALRVIYNESDALMAQVSTSCRSGCWHCCCQLPVVFHDEAEALAEAVVALPGWEALLPALRRDALAAGDSGEEFFARGVPCALLREDRTCSVYASRPAACRYHFSDGNPEDCRTGRGGRNLRGDYQEQLAALGQRALAYLPRAGIRFGPLPLVLLWALRDRDHRRSVREATRGLPTPVRWHDLHGEAMTREIRARQGKTP